MHTYYIHKPSAFYTLDVILHVVYIPTMMVLMYDSFILINGVEIFLKSLLGDHGTQRTWPAGSEVSLISRLAVIYTNMQISAVSVRRQCILYKL